VAVPAGSKHTAALWNLSAMGAVGANGKRRFLLVGLLADLVKAVGPLL